ncbi:RNA polymerase sigma-70 factor (ECF subfamily) [Streptosporangium album]|uniref:RNA polymerase sigma factor n=1 Tax=Streptosporangium album TaxID=47479 RepID=A0A7W7RSQ4_9ACTN|nr:sigma-70 family RNA polymerase sigma factor [Streptosporangium album]MBB4937192.1 RNA polymerase sigma-70 factor (ECF subfamily) [Streptosporangium album]
MARDEDFVRLTDPFRRELLTYCYRMVGSGGDAEDLVQETYLSAWRAYDGFEGRSSLRTWLYRIATRACLKAIERDGRRPLPSGLGAPGDDPDAPLAPTMPEVPWLQPLPDPATVVESQQSMRLAFVAALQYLPARQRAVLILRDVLTWRAREVADLLETSTAAVNSALQRARAQLAGASLEEEKLAEPADPFQRDVLDRYTAAFENADIEALMKVVTEDAAWEMPPYPTWFVGREHIRRHLAPRLDAVFTALPVRANGQPAVALYRDGRPHAIQVLTVTTEGITRIITFHDHPGLFRSFGL